MTTPSRDAALTWEVPPEVDRDLHNRVAASARAAYLEASAEHIDAIVLQLLEQQHVQNAQLWGPLIGRLARDAAGFISLAYLRSLSLSSLIDELDAQYAAIQVKEVVVPRAELPQLGSCAIDGVVLQKNVAHKRMRTLINNPRIVTLSGALDQEAAQTNNRLSSIDALMDNEQQRLHNWVEALKATAPDVVLVEGTTNRHIQDLLLEAGISLVTSVKPEMLRRVARCVGSQISPVGHAIAASAVGSCQIFEVVVQPPSAGNGAAAEAEPVPMMYFKGAARGMGATIVLQSDNPDDLKKVRTVALEASYAALWNCVEAAYLADQYLIAAAALQPSLLFDKSSNAALLAARESVAAAAAARSGGPITCASPHCSVFGGAEQLRQELNYSYDFSCTQELWLSISCRNPAKGTRCESPHLHSMKYYQQGDLPLADFLAAAAPMNRKCPHPQCGDGASLHLRSFFHGNALVTLSSVHLPPDNEIPGQGEEGQVWMWMRPIGKNSDVCEESAQVVRVPLSLDAARISFAHLLTLLLDGRHLSIAGASLQHDFVRYLGFGSTIICLHHSVINPYSIVLPPRTLCVAQADTSRWLAEEVAMLTEEADENFDALQESLPVSLSGGSADEAESCSEALSDVRVAFMKALREIPVCIPSQAVDELTLALQSINTLRRHLAHLLQQWDAALVQADSTTAPALESNAGQGQAPSPPLHSRTSSSASSATAAALAAPVMPAVGSLPTSSYAAPKLVDALTSSSPPASREISHVENIPTGLVARYISHFEEQEQLGLPRVDSNKDVGLLAKRQFGPSTTIDLRNDEIVEDLESKLERLSRNLASFSISAEHINEADRPKAVRPHSTVSSRAYLAGRHVLLEGEGESVITVYDKEPTSVVAFFLSQHQSYLEAAKADCLQAPEQDSELNAESSEAEKPSLSDDELILRASLQLDCQMIAEDESSAEGARARFQLTAYYAPHFAALRSMCVAGGEAAYLASMERCVPWSAQGGKSNVFFAKTKDDRYVIKQLTKSEKQSVLEYAPDYFKYHQQSLAAGGKSCLAKVVGLYQVQIDYSNGLPSPLGKEGSMDFIVMENLFHGCDIRTIYDLKGSERDRYIAESHAKVPSGPSVLLDDNMRELNRLTPTLVAPSAFTKLQQSLSDDTSFLASLGVMDYSLLVGFNKTNQELVVGLVDYVRQYTWDKQIESWVKKTGLLGGAGKEPTIISPHQYARRFRAAMLSYFTMVPCLGNPINLDNSQ